MNLGRRGLRRYRSLLRALVDRGYEIRPLGVWARDGQNGNRTVLLRHDVDQDPSAAMRMAEIEREMGVSGTWYVRWRTASPELLGLLRGHDLEVGLHYESLSRLGRRLGITTATGLEPVVPVAAAYLEAEVRIFAHLHGACPSICPHGDSALPFARNADLVRHAGVGSLGVDFDARAVMAAAERAGWAWLTDDRQAKRRGMPPDRDPLAHGGDRLMLVIHPNNWVRTFGWSGPTTRPDDPPC
jgi:hypothetical protein